MEVVVGVVVAVAVLVPLWLHNRLVKLRNRTESSWADLDVQLARRADLVPNLVAVVSGYARHERELIEAVTAARHRADAERSAEAGGRSAPRPGAAQPVAAHRRAQVEQELAGRVEQVIALAEAYPQLHADARFRQLSDELTATENKIAFSRQLYNDTVDAYRTAAQSFPGVLVARPMGFDPPEFFMPRGTEWVDGRGSAVRSEDFR